MITIEGLTLKQRILANILWQIDSGEAIERFISSLLPRDQAEAKTVLELIVIASHDTVDDVSMATNFLTDIMER
jgi:hypothetical protein